MWLNPDGLFMDGLYEQEQAKPPNLSFTGEKTFQGGLLNVNLKPGY